MKIKKASGFRGLLLATLLFSGAPSVRAALENDFIYQEGVFQKEGDCWFQAFTLPGSAAQAFVLRFASDYYCDAAILPAEQLGNFTNNLSFTGAAVLTNQIGTQFATLSNGTYYVCARSQISGANRYRLELDRKIDLPADGEYSYSFYDYCMNTAVYLDAEGGLLWHGFTIEAGVRYLLDGCNSGVETYIIPASELPAFLAGGTFQNYAAYSDPGANGASPGLYEIELPPGDYYFACVNPTAINRAIVYTMERWVKKAVPFNVTVYFDAQGGSGSAPSKTVKRGAAYGALPLPTRSDSIFGGWWTEPGGAGAQVTAATVVTAATNHTLYAFWIPLAEVPTYPATVGVAFGCDLSAIVGAAGNVAVKGVPSGLKYNSATRRVEGVPAKTGEFTVQVFSSGSLLGAVRLKIAGLPAWAQGSFNGCVAGCGPATMAVTAAGKVSGKIAVAGTNYTFGAASFSAGGDPTNGFSFVATAKAGKSLLPLALTVVPAETSLALGAATGTVGGLGAALWRDVWKSEAARLAPLSGYYTATLAGTDEYGSGYLTLTVDKAGKVKVGGKLADGTAVSLSGSLILDASNRMFAVVYAVPAAYKGGSLFGLAEFVGPTEGDPFLRPLDGVPFAWESLSPQATEAYGAGFAREVVLAGGWYSKTQNLVDYYAGKVLAAAAAPGAVAPELTVGTNRYASVCWGPSGAVLTPVLKSGVMTGLAAPPAGKPVDPDKDGAWDYSATNAVGLKISLARPTGLFKGSFLAWFDYPEKKHVSKSLTFEGALTPVREDPADGVEGRGYFLWADKAAIQGTKKTYSFKWSYDLLLRGN